MKLLIRPALALLLATLMVLATILTLGREGYLFRGTGLAFPYLVWPVVAATLLLLGAELCRWLGRDPGLGLLRRLTGSRAPADEAARQTAPLVLSLLGASLAGAAVLVLLYGALLALPRAADTLSGHQRVPDPSALRPYLNVSANLAGWALAALAPFALVRVARLAWPGLGRILPLPLVRLLLLGLAYILLTSNGVLATAFGYDGSGFLAALALATALTYLASTAGRLRADSPTWPSRRWLDRTLMADLLDGLAAFGRAGAVALLLWSALDSLPRVSANLLDHQSTSSLGDRSLPYLEQLYEARYLAAMLALALGVTLGLPRQLRSLSQYGLGYLSLVRAVALTALGCLAWLLGTALASLGHGYPLLGAMAAAGLFGLAAAQVASYATEASYSPVARLARWLAGSRIRAFSLGVSLAFYGLLLRPLFYELLRFAPIYEWVVVLCVGSVLLTRSRRQVGDEAEAPRDRVARWPGWSRHQQVIEEIPDERFDSLLALQRRFIDTGQWWFVWTYFLGILLRNGAPRPAIYPVFQPLRACVLASLKGDPWPGHQKRLRDRRAAALTSALESMKSAMDRAAFPPEPVGQAQVQQIGEAFLEEGAAPEALAVTLAAAYWQQGSSVSRAIALWFPLMTLVDRSARWYDPPWTRRKVHRWNLARRRGIVEGALAHLFQGATQECLAVAVPSRQGLRFTGPMAGYSPVQGLGVEILGQTEYHYLVRVENDAQGYVVKSTLLRQPVLPGDA